MQHSKSKQVSFWTQFEIEIMDIMEVGIRIDWIGKNTTISMNLQM